PWDPSAVGAASCLTTRGVAPGEYKVAAATKKGQLRRAVGGGGGQYNLVCCVAATRREPVRIVGAGSVSGGVWSCSEPRETKHERRTDSGLREVERPNPAAGP